MVGQLPPGARIGSELQIYQLLVTAQTKSASLYTQHPIDLANAGTGSAADNVTGHESPDQVPDRVD